MYFDLLIDPVQRVALRTRDRLLILLWRSALAERVGLRWHPNSNFRVDSGSKHRQQVLVPRVLLHSSEFVFQNLLQTINCHQIY